MNNTVVKYKCAPVLDKAPHHEGTG